MAKEKGMTLKRPSTNAKEKAFVNEADRSASEAAKTELTGDRAWEGEGVSEKVIKPFNLRPNEPDSLKMEFIVKNSPKFRSKHDFCMQAVQAAIEAELKELLGE